MKYLIAILLSVTCFGLVQGSLFPVCEPDSVTWHPHPFDCRLYFICHLGFLVNMTCAPNLHFDRDELVCKPDHLANCQLQTGVHCEVPDDPNQVVFIPNPLDCTSYFVCFNGDPIERTCHTNLYWDANHDWCNFPEVANCHPDTPQARNRTTTAAPGPTTTTTPGTTTPTTTTPTTTTRNPDIMDCPLQPGTQLHPHTRDCWRYFVCTDGIASLRDCAPGMLFDNVGRVCAPAASATCFPGSNPNRP